MQKAFQILIVEDEKRIGELIRRLIHWDELGAVCMGLAGNGEIALEMIRMQRPSIVITDIRMPRIGGIELLRRSSQSWPSVRFIVLSGYKEFAYAQKAIEYGAEGYLLKPINEQELNDVLARTIRKLTQERKDEQEREQLQIVFEESRSIIKRDFLRTIIEQDEAAPVRDERVSLRGEIFCGIDIKIDRPDTAAADSAASVNAGAQRDIGAGREPRQERVIAEQVVRIVEQKLAPVTEEILTCVKDALHIYCLFNYNAENARQIRTSMHELLIGIREYLLKYEQYEVTIGIGTEKDAFDQIRFSILEAHRAVGNRIVKGRGRLLYFNALGELPPWKSPVTGHEEEIISLVEDMAQEKLSGLLQQYFAGITEDPYADYSRCYDLAGELIDLYFDYTQREAASAASGRKQAQNDKEHIVSAAELTSFVTGLYTDLIGSRREQMQQESARPIRLAKAYVDEHYAEKITLETVADVIGFNPAYFSVLFKRETGMNFSAYLTAVRIENAKKLLKETNETVAAVADRVGYRDSRSFSQTFTKVTGIKPALYRRMHA